jgi:hypothetical protein
MPGAGLAPGLCYGPAIEEGLGAKTPEGTATRQPPRVPHGDPKVLRRLRVHCERCPIQQTSKAYVGLLFRAQGRPRYMTSRIGWLELLRLREFSSPQLKSLEKIGDHQ